MKTKRKSSMCIMKIIAILTQEGLNYIASFAMLTFF